MGGYGYRYERYSSAHTTMGSRTDEAFGPVIRRLFFPSSNVSTEDYYDHDYVPKKTAVPITTKPYDDDNKHGSPTKASPARSDNEWHRQTSPVHVHGRPQRGHELPTRRTIVPIDTRPYGGEEYEHSSPTKPYYASDDDDEWRRPHRDDGLLTKRTGVPVATRSYGGDKYKHSSPTKPYHASDEDEWRRLRRDDGLLTRKTGVPVATGPYGGDEYRHSSPTKPYHASDDDQWRRPYRDDGLLTKKTGVPVAAGPYGGDEYKHGYPKEAYPARDDDKWHRQKADEWLTKRPTMPVATRPHGHDYVRSPPTKEAYPAGHDNDPKRHRPQKPQASPPVISTDWRRSPRSISDNGSNPSNKDHRKSIDSPNRSGKPVISQGWSSLPRNGTRLSEATNDIDEVAELMRQNAGLGRTSEGDYRGNKPTANNAFTIPSDNERANAGLRDAPPSNNGIDNPIDARRRFPTIDSAEAAWKYNGRRV